MNGSLVETAATSSTNTCTKPRPLAYPPTEADVFLGRGKGSYGRQGNLLYTSIIRSHVTMYMKLTKNQDKIRLTQQIVELVKTKGCRFLRRAEATSVGKGAAKRSGSSKEEEEGEEEEEEEEGELYEVSDVEARLKVAQALRHRRGLILREQRRQAARPTGRATAATPTQRGGRQRSSSSTKKKKGRSASSSKRRTTTKQSPVNPQTMVSPQPEETIKTPPAAAAALVESLPAVARLLHQDSDSRVGVWSVASDPGSRRTNEHRLDVPHQQPEHQDKNLAEPLAWSRSWTSHHHGNHNGMADSYNHHPSLPLLDASVASLVAAMFPSHHQQQQDTILFRNEPCGTGATRSMEHSLWMDPSLGRVAHHEQVGTMLDAHRYRHDHQQPPLKTNPQEDNDADEHLELASLSTMSSTGIFAEDAHAMEEEEEEDTTTTINEHDVPCKTSTIATMRVPELLGFHHGQQQRPEPLQAHAREQGLQLDNNRHHHQQQQDEEESDCWWDPIPLAPGATPAAVTLESAGWNGLSSMQGV